MTIARTLISVAGRVRLRARSAWWSVTAPRPSSGAGRLRFRDGRVSARVVIGRDASLHLGGDLHLESHLGDEGTATIVLNPGSRLVIDGDLTLGPGLLIMLAPRATLRIGGRRQGSGSGFTARSTILVRRSVELGADCIVAPDTFITDCDWHGIEGSVPDLPTRLGDGVWVARGASILKGTTIGRGSVVAAGAVCREGSIAEQSLAAGVPARVVRSGIRWSREMPTAEDGSG
jgi:hypothetical protein